MMGMKNLSQKSHFHMENGGNIKGVYPYPWSLEICIRPPIAETAKARSWALPKYIWTNVRQKLKTIEKPVRYALCSLSLLTRE